MNSVQERLLAKVSVNAETGCWEWTAGKIWSGYGQIRIGGKTVYAHRVSYEIHCGPIPSELKVLHECDNPSCINPKHLFLGTQAENVADRNAKGRQARGEIVGQAKLTEVEVLAIRAARGISQRQLAARYGISGTHVGSIRSGKVWKHLREVANG